MTVTDRRHRSGFTLVEVMVAITLSAGLLLAGRSIMEEIANTAQSLNRESSTATATIQQENALETLFRDVEAGPRNPFSGTIQRDSLAFVGTSQTMRFWSWCDGLGGTKSRCEIRLHLDTTLVVMQGNTDSAILKRSNRMFGTFRYLGDPHYGGSWYRSWGPGVTAPPAIALIVGTDTTVFRTGKRG